MILILSDATDHSTSAVTEWLIWYGVRFQRVNAESCFLSCSLALDEKGVMRIALKNTRGESFNLADYSAYWYRRGDFNLATPKISKYKRLTLAMLRKEWDRINGAIHFFLEQRPHLGTIGQEKHHNKIISLATAANAGLSIPNTLITTEKPELMEFFRNGEVITKAVWNLFRIHTRRFFRSVGTQLLRRENITMLENTISPALVQREIPKVCELRVFILKESCYAMAIFSQNDPQTRVDFRNYNKEKPNRCVPFLLPGALKRKLLEFMARMQLDSGSVDLIVTPDNEFVFLEVNPVGQFGWVSANCNYYLEEKIALYLKTLTA